MRITKPSTKPRGSDLTRHVGERLFRLRQLNQMTMRTVAEGAGLSVAFVCEIENGHACPSIETLWKLAQFFGEDVGWFVDGYKEHNDA